MNIRFLLLALLLVGSSAGAETIAGGSINPS